MSQRTVQRHISELERAGYLERQALKGTLYEHRVYEEAKLRSRDVDGTVGSLLRGLKPSYHPRQPLPLLRLR